AESAGKEASKAAEDAGKLGKPPRNRITVLAQLRKKRCKVYFDIGSGDRDEMTEEAKIFFKKIQDARKQAVAPKEGEAVGDTNIKVVVNQRSPGGGAGGGGRGVGSAPRGGGGGMTATTPTAGKPFRILFGGQVQGPYSLD